MDKSKVARIRIKETTARRSSLSTEISSSSFSAQYEQFQMQVHSSKGMEPKKKKRNSEKEREKEKKEVLESMKRSFEEKPSQQQSPTLRKASPSLRYKMARHTMRRISTELSLEQHKKILQQKQEMLESFENEKSKLRRSFSDPCIIATWEAFDLDDYGIDSKLEEFSQELSFADSKDDCLLLINSWKKSLSPKKKPKVRIKPLQKLMEMKKKEESIQLSDLVNSRNLFSLKKPKVLSSPKRTSPRGKSNSNGDISSETSTDEESYYAFQNLFSVIEKRSEIILGQDTLSGRPGIKAGNLHAVIAKLVEWISQEGTFSFLILNCELLTNKKLR